MAQPLIVPVNMWSDLAFELGLQTRCAEALIVHGARDFFRLDYIIEPCNREYIQGRDQAKGMNLRPYWTQEKRRHCIRTRRQTTNGGHGHYSLFSFIKLRYMFVLIFTCCMVESICICSYCQDTGHPVISRNMLIFQLSAF